MTIMPNPARDYAVLTFSAERDSEITIRLLDNVGKTVLLQKQKVLGGTNTLQLKNLDKYSSGVYVVQVLINNELVSEKLVLTK